VTPMWFLPPMIAGLPDQKRLNVANVAIERSCLLRAIMLSRLSDVALLSFQLRRNVAMPERNVLCFLCFDLRSGRDRHNLVRGAIAEGALRTVVMGATRFAVMRYGWLLSYGGNSCLAGLRLCSHSCATSPDVVALLQYWSLSSLRGEACMALLACVLGHRLQDQGEAKDWRPGDDQSKRPRRSVAPGSRPIEVVRGTIEVK
jgi:hypothetical protein